MFNFFNKKTDTTTKHASSIDLNSGLRFISFGDSSAGITKPIQLACETSVVDTVIRFISGWFSQADIYAIDENGEIVDTEITTKLKQPNQYQSRDAFISQWVYFLLANGQVFTYPKSRYRTFRSIEDTDFINLNPDNVTYTKHQTSIFNRNVKDERVKYTEDFGGKQEVTEFTSSELINFINKLNGSKSLYTGESPLNSLKADIKAITIAEKAKQNKIQLSGLTFVSPDANGSTMTDYSLDKPVIDKKKGNNITQKDLIENKVRSASLSNDGKGVLFSSVPLKSFNPTEHLKALDFDKEVKENKENIYRKFGVHKVLMGEDATYENQDAITLSFLQNVIEPLGKIFIQGFKEYEQEGTTLVITWEHLKIYQEYNKLQAESKQMEVNNIILLFEKGLITQEDATARIQEIWN